MQMTLCCCDGKTGATGNDWQVLWNDTDLGKNWGDGNLKWSTPVQIMIDQKQLENVEYFNCLGSLITHNRKCTCEIESRIVMEKATLNMKKTFHQKIWRNVRKKLVTCHIWSTALYGAETWTLRNVDHKYLERFQMWCWRRMEKISCTDRVRNEYHTESRTVILYIK